MRDFCNQDHLTDTARWQATGLFTGSEELSRLTAAQMSALLLYDDWPQKHEGPGDVGESEGLGGLVAQMKKDNKVEEEEEQDGQETEEHADRRHALQLDGPRHEYPLLVELDALVADIKEREEKGELSGYAQWEDDVKRAQGIFLETPDELPAWLDRMRIKRLNEQEMRLRVVDLADRLVKQATIAIPPQTWNVNVADAQNPDHQPTEEELLVFRLGFVFLAYRIDFWWWESVEVGSGCPQNFARPVVWFCLTLLFLFDCILLTRLLAPPDAP